MNTKLINHVKIGVCEFPARTEVQIKEAIEKCTVVRKDGLITPFLHKFKLMEELGLK